MARFALWLSLAVAPVLAQTAHINSTSGNVTAQSAAGGPSVPAAPDTLVVSGTTLITAKRSTAAVDFDWANGMQLNPETEVRLAQLEPGQYTAEVVRGSVTWWVRADSSAHAEVQTPSVTAAPSKAGVYQIGLTTGGESEIVAWEGAIEVRAPGGSEWVSAGQKMVARGSAANPEFRIVSAVSRWKRFASVLANVMQTVNVVADLASSIEGGGRAPEDRSVLPGHSAHTPSQGAANHPSNGSPALPAHSAPPSSHAGPGAPMHASPAGSGHGSSPAPAHASAAPAASHADPAKAK